MKINKYGIAVFVTVVCACVSTSYGNRKKTDVKTVGTAVSEDYLYRQRPKQRECTDKEDALTSLRNVKKKASKGSKGGSKSDVATQESAFVVAWVNNDVITNRDVEYAAKFVFLSAGKEFDKQTARLMAVALVTAMIEERLLIQCAQRVSLNIPDEEVEARIEEIKKIPQPGGATLDDILHAHKISKAAFREYIRDRITIQTVTQSITGDINVSKNEIEEKMAQEKRALQARRHIITELLFNRDRLTDDETAKKNAEIALKLVMGGFSIKVIAETISPKMQSGGSSAEKQVREDALGKNIRIAVKGMTPGECSGIIKTNAGYAIVFVHDSAESGKDWLRQGRHKLYCARLSSKQPPLAGLDQAAGNKLIGDLVETDSVAAFKTKCGLHLIPIEELTATPDEPELVEIAMRSRYSGNPIPVMMQEDGGEIGVFMYESSVCGAAQLPSREEIVERVMRDKYQREVRNTFSKVESVARISIDTNVLKKVFE
ncbi:MAG: SurA N-terminal domain-containing protein [Holosporales bacterium]|jgi:hypothetical protein|nr:SurA N-terminal domain-containing protein [Holosporales bacterium]